MTGHLREAFLTSTYGTAQERFRLDRARGPAPSWTQGTWGIVTAWNPDGQRAAVQDNKQAAAALLAQVRGEGFSPLPAHNGEGEWREEALLVPGVRLSRVASWGVECGQAAVLWGTGSRVALVWLDVRGRVEQVERFWAQRA